MLEAWTLSARDVVSLLRQGKVSSIDLIDIAEERLKVAEPAIHAIPITCFERARAKASKLTHPEKPGPAYLYGLPIVVKDSAAVRGVQWTKGSRIFEERVAQENDPHVQFLENNGAIIIGKSNMPEFGAGANTYNDLFGETRNPWDPTCTCGGSSGGTAAALAAGEVWLGTGGDLGGSLRIPASFCGIVGLRPSVGIVPQAFARIDDVKAVSGPMARNVADLALLLDAMSGQHPRDPESISSPEGGFQEAAKALLRPLKARIAWTSNLGGISPVHPEVEATCYTAVQWLESQGAELANAYPDLSDSEHIFQVLRAHQFSRDFGSMMSDPDSRAQLKPEMIWQIETGLEQDDKEVQEAQKSLEALQARFKAFFQEFDFLCTPCVMVPPFDVRIRWLREAQGKKFTNYVQWLIMTFAISLVDAPALSLPCGLSKTGLPIGLQIVGGHRQDAAVLALAATYEDAHPWKDLVPCLRQQS